MDTYKLTFTHKDTGETWSNTYMDFADVHAAMVWWTGDCDRGQSVAKRIDNQPMYAEWDNLLGATAREFGLEEAP